MRKIKQPTDKKKDRKEGRKERKKDLRILFTESVLENNTSVKNFTDSEIDSKAKLAHNTDNQFKHCSVLKC